MTCKQEAESYSDPDGHPDLLFMSALFSELPSDCLRQPIDYQVLTICSRLRKGKNIAESHFEIFLRNFREVTRERKNENNAYGYKNFFPLFFNRNSDVIKTPYYE
ncbi:hypothetical protein AVEN_91704-1 [Araneus ventricosus]|uniref:Uncharacterized protein n=1 Tax=Araneus ventricosus TaxID=182803 RepID=A0A4Y2HI04_ARAVE|nr:hypothetical protein AVEN_91704-1 [Araneus ventricosus]